MCVCVRVCDPVRLCVCATETRNGELCFCNSWYDAIRLADSCGNVVQRGARAKAVAGQRVGRSSLSHDLVCEYRFARRPDLPINCRGAPLNLPLHVRLSAVVHPIVVTPKLRTSVEAHRLACGRRRMCKAHRMHPPRVPPLDGAAIHLYGSRSKSRPACPDHLHKMQRLLRPMVGPRLVSTNPVTTLPFVWRTSARPRPRSGTNERIVASLSFELCGVVAHRPVL